MKIRFLLAEYLPKMDMLGTLDAYFFMEYAGVHYKTEVVTQKDNKTPINQEWWIPI